MCLSEEDAELFFKLFFLLIKYTNSVYNIDKSLKKLKREEVDNLGKLKEAADILWKNTSLIDDYLKKDTTLSEREVNIIKSWKRCVPGIYIVERFLKKGAVFVGKKDCYIVSGISNPIEDTLMFCTLPVVMQATLLPFEKCIITDGLLSLGQISIGPGMKKGFKEIYMKAKKSGNLHTTL